MTQIPRERQGTGPPVKARGGGGADVREMEAGRGRKGPLEGITPGADTNLGVD